jgi:hypothetical protein
MMGPVVGKQGTSICFSKGGKVGFTLSNKRSGVNFINVLRTDFALVDPESVKSHQCLFTLSGSTSVKAVHRMLMKLSPVRLIGK